MLELKEEVRTSLAALGEKNWPMLSNDQFGTIKLLKSLESITKLMSAETLSSLIDICNGLKQEV